MLRIINGSVASKSIFSDEDDMERACNSKVIIEPGVVDKKSETGFFTSEARLVFVK